jgi:RNA-directed DNA polymerase
LISGGETTVTVRGQGRGGRNVEFLLALAVELQGEPNVWPIAGDTDGVDGAEEGAVAIVTPDTLARAAAKGVDAKAILADNDAHSLFEARALGIPTIRDRVVQTAAKLVLEPIFEAGFEDNAYGYRPARRAVDAVKEVHRLICQGYTDVVDADLSRYFDSIPHNELLKSVARRVADGSVLRLIKLWLKAPIEERGADGTRRMSGGKGNTRGTPQGGVASPLLANIYMNRFLKYWRLTGRGEALRAHVVSYADDFVILSRGRAVEALTWTRAVMTRLGLTLNEAKTSLKDARRDRFDFLGYSFGPHYYKANGQRYLGASPSKKSVRRLKTTVGNLLGPGNNDPWWEVRDTLNRSLRGWSNYFSYGTRRSAFRGVDRYVYERVRDFLARRHKVAGRGTRRFSCDVVYGERGLLRLERLPLTAPPCALR